MAWHFSPLPIDSFIFHQDTGMKKDKKISKKEEFFNLL
jgi:hypothetical protein